MKLNEIKYLQETLSFPKVEKMLRNLDITEQEYRILPDGSVDILQGGVYFPKELCKNGKIPIKFREVYGGFYVEGCDLTSLEGCPEKVVGVFSCEDNPALTSLEHGPKLVTDKYNARYTGITSLKGIAGFFKDTKHRIIDLTGCHQLKTVDCFKDIPCAISELKHSDSQFKSLIGIDDALQHGFVGDGILSLNFNEVKEGGVMLLLIEGLKGLHNDHGLPEPFRIIKKFIGTGDGLEAQIELIDKGFDDYAL